MKEEKNTRIMITSFVENVNKKSIRRIIIAQIVTIRKLIFIKNIILNLDHQKNQKLEFLRCQITIWIRVKDKKNIRIIVQYVKIVIKKLVSGIINAMIVIIRKSTLMKKFVSDL